MARITNFERYQEALAFLRESAAAIDQAHAIVAELGLAPEIETHKIAPVRYVGIGTLSSHVDAMALSLANAECDDCGHAVSKHGDKYGCEHELGDEGRPCGCTWGSAAVGRDRRAA
jgi:hypothetical protein